MTTGSPLAADYREARQRFLDAAAGAGASPTAFDHPTETGPDGGPLAIDVAQLGPADSPAVLLVVSGTHGVEGYAGSAIQTDWLERLGAGSPPSGLRVVLIHALNPYGFAWTRRTNEDNVDLNRNFIDWDEPPPDNPAYDQLADALVPDRWDDATKEATTMTLLAEVERLGLEEMQRVVSGGQYRHERGVFYGGTGPVWSRRWLTDHIGSLAEPATRVGIIDLHTGLGPWGHGELIVHGSRAEPGYRRAERWWGDVRSMQDGESVSAELSGGWLGRIEALLPEIEVTAAALEFGTVDAIQVLQALRGEAWLHGQDRSVVEGPEGAQVRAEVRRAFLDDGPDWLPTLLGRFDQVATAAVAGLDA
mgnify:FL=1